MVVNWNAVEAVSNCVVALGLLVALLQIRQTQRNRTTDFEDSLSGEYRTIIHNLPVDAVLGRPISADLLQKSLPDFLSYFDLSNEEIYLRMNGRISKEAWLDWQDGIRQNLQFPAFRDAWTKLGAVSKERFRDLRQLEEFNFKTDPKKWDVRVKRNMVGES